MYHCHTARLVTWAAIATAGMTGAQAVEVEPASVVFTAPGQTQMLSVTNNGQPVPASAIGYTVMIGEHDYNEMFEFGTADGQLSLTSIDYTQVGQYDLIVKTDAGNATVKVYTPLSEMDSVLETMAKRQGTTVEAVRKQLGMSEGLRSRIEIGLPPVYYEGDVLELTMPVAEGATPVWSVNGEVVEEGSGTFRHVFVEPGSYVVSYNEMKDGTVVAGAHAHAEIVPYPAIPWKVPANSKLTLPIFPGFKTYTWTLDGEAVTDARPQHELVLAAGKHTLVCMAQEPVDGHPDAFKRLTYEIIAEK